MKSVPLRSRRPALRPPFLAHFLSLWSLFIVAVGLGAETLTVTTTEPSGAGSLLEAIQNASDGDRIEFAASLFEGPLPVEIRSTGVVSGNGFRVGKQLTIVGPGADQLVLSGDNAGRVFEVSFDETGEPDLTLENLTVANGLSDRGAGILVREGTRLQLNQVVVRDNTADGYGGGIYNEGTSTLTGSTISGNVARPILGDGGLFAGNGGGLFNAARFEEIPDEVGLALAGALLEVVDSRIVNNSGGEEGGGIANRGILTITDSTLSGNQVAGSGGGLFSRGSTRIIRSLISANTAAQSDGGGLVAGFQSYTEIENSTLSGNRAPEGGGGGIFLFGSGSESQPTRLVLVSSTVADNTAAEAAGGILVRNPFGDVFALGTIIAGNTIPGEGAPVALDVASESEAGFNSFGFNLIGADPVGVWPLGGLEDQVGVDPLLAPLADNGGSSATHALLPESPAIDRGDPLYNTVEPLYSDTDQRGEGFPRQLDGNGSGTPRIDVGAFEALPACEEPPVVTLLGETEVTLEQGGPFCSASFVDPGATATSCAGTPLEVITTYPPGTSVLGGVVRFGAPGFYLFTYRATDAGGRTAQTTRLIEVVDLTPPALVILPGPTSVDATDPLNCEAVFSGIDALGFDCGPTTVSFAIDGPDEIRIPITFPATFPVGAHRVYVTATDAAGNESAVQTVIVTVNDRAAPVLTLNDPALNDVTIPYGSVFLDPGATALDACEGAVPVWVDPTGGVDPCTPGPHLLTYRAEDSAGNVATATRLITVAEPEISLSVPEATVEVDVNPALCAAPLDLSSLVSVTGLSAVCEDLFVRVTIARPDTEESVQLDALEPYAFPLGTSFVTVQVLAADEVPVELAAASFTVEVSDPFLACLKNVAWPLAYPLPLEPVATASGPKVSFGMVQQFLTRPGESRWYKFVGTPGSQVIVTLSDLPENFDVVVYGDIQQAFDELNGLIESGDEDDALLALLGAEFAPEAYSPEAYSPEAYSPEAYSPEAYSPEAYSPEAYSPEAYSPEAYSPEAYSPEAYSPEAYSPEAYSPEAYSPEAYSPEAYSGAQTRSLIAFSAGAGTSSEEVQFNTYSRSGEFYVRVRGRNGIFSLAQPYTLGIQLEQEVCETVTDFNDTPASIPDAGGATSLILWDSTRIAGTAAERAALATSLTGFASAANAFVYDLSADARVNALNAQADASPTCPLAKNLVGEVIRNIIQGIRANQPAIADLTLIGNDEAIPFFRTNDEALLASEANYFPPVFDQTHANSSLRFGQVLTQDRYGSACRIFLSTGPFDLPGIPVGRVVETATEVAAYLEVYRPLFANGNNGVLPVPDSVFVSGYDFLDDAARAVRDDFALGLGAGARVEDLIAPFGAAPAEGWTADQLRAFLFGQRHDLSFLAGHFSQSGALAADYTTRVTAAELAASEVDLAFAFFMSTGCHSGFQTVDEAAVPIVTEQPDWPQAFMRKFAILLAGTGYQYGDTDFLEYSERLYLEMAQALRTGTGPVSIGNALVAAKNRYLAETPLMRGIHEKSLIQVALYGLPMIKLDLPGERLTPPSRDSDAGTPVLVAGGPGRDLDLFATELLLNPTLELLSKPLNVIGAGGSVVDTVIASWLEGADGRVTLPAEPIRPLERRNLTRPEGLVKDVLFLGGPYTDLPGILPLTGAPATEIRGVHGIFATDVFYPIRPWNLNHIGLLCGGVGGSFLNAFPAQFISDAPGSPTGVLRRFDEMAFKVFYSPNLSATALAAAPAINIVASTVDGDDLVFTTEVAAAESVGVQEVWISYTGAPVSRFYGQWQSFQLTGPADPTARGIGTWTGVLPGAATEGGAVFYMVQAVNGLGRVALNSNFGRYFRIGTSSLDGAEASAEEASLAFAPAAPTTAEYRGTISVSAQLTDAAGQPIAGRLITFRIGTQVASALTDGTGHAAVSPLLAIAPGAYQLGASFAGDEAYEAVAIASPFTVRPQGTALSIVSGEEAAAVTDIVARLIANDGTPLKEKTLLFVFEGPTTATAVSVITDGAGQGRPTFVELPPDRYRVTVFFAQAVLLPSGITVTLADRLYGPSSVSTEIQIGAPTGLELQDERILVIYSDRKAPGASHRNRGHGKTRLSGTLRFSDPSTDPAVLFADPDTYRLTAALTATLSNQTLADGELILERHGRHEGHLSGDGWIDGARVSLDLRWKPPVFKALLGDRKAPEVKSIQFGPSLTLLSYDPAKGDYRTVISGPGGATTVVVKKGRVIEVAGAVSAACLIPSKGGKAIIALPFALTPGTTLVTTGDFSSTVTVTLGENLEGASGDFRLVIDTPSGRGPLYDDLPAVLEVQLTLGAGEGESAFGFRSITGDAEHPWTKERQNLRTRR